MISLQMKRSGELPGKIIEAIQQVDIDETDLVKKLTLMKPVDNLLARDDFYHSITINGKMNIP